LSLGIVTKNVQEDIMELGTNPQALLEYNPAAYEALPECYQNDSSLNFFVDVNNNLCAEHTLHDEVYIFTDGNWARVKW
jgi:hypothetical protein